MIFVTVGSQAPFDRMIRAVDEWASARGRSDVTAQIAKGLYRPKYIKYTDFIGPSEFRQSIDSSKLIVAHAGMGSIISSLEAGKPIVVMPRRGCFRETRNDHQVAAAKYFAEQGRIIVANDEHDLGEKLDLGATLSERTPIAPQASPQLIATIQTFLSEA